MIAYFALFGIVVLIHLLPSRNKRVANIKLFLSFLLIFFYASIRVDHGRDYTAYLNIYNDIKMFFGTINYEVRYEIGYVLLNKLMPSHRSLLVILSAFTCFTYYWTFRNYIPQQYYVLGFFLMALFGNMLLFFQLSGLRNAIAINIMTLSLPLIIKRKLLPYIFLTILAFTFHQSAVLFMPIAYFVATPDVFKKNDIIKWSVVALFFIMASTAKLTNLIAPLINSYFDKYNSYLDNAYDLSGEVSFLILGFVAALFTISFIILRKVDLSQAERVIFKLSLLFVISFTLGTLNLRSSQYFAPFFLISTIIVCYKVNRPIVKISYISAVLLYLSYSFFVDFMGDPHFTYEFYRTIFD